MPNISNPSIATAATNVTDALAREWRRLGLRRDVADVVAAWRCGDPELDRWAQGHLCGVHHVDGVLGALHHRHGEAADRLLHWLLLVARTESLAGRIALQRVVPLAVREARRWAPTDGRPAPVDDVITAAAIAIGAYDDPAPRRHIAPRLVDVAIHHAVRGPYRRRRHRAELLATHCRLDRVAQPHRELEPLVAAHRVLLAAASAGVDRTLLDMARRMARGESTVEIAGAHGCTDRSVRNRRRRLASDVRRVLDDSWCDWHDPMTGIEFERSVAMAGS